jgi:hypothetical protein
MIEHPYLTDARAHHGRTIHALAQTWGVDPSVAHARLIHLRRTQTDVPRVDGDGVICDPLQAVKPADAERATPAEWTQIEDDPNPAETFNGVMRGPYRFDLAPIPPTDERLQARADALATGTGGDSVATRLNRIAMIKARAVRALAQADPLAFGRAIADRAECSSVARLAWSEVGA